LNPLPHQPLSDPELPASRPRIGTLDQFRGYAVAGMIVVNFLGGYACIPAILKHHNSYCSYADTIMPHFLFAVGFAIALVWNRAATGDRGQASAVQWRLARRAVALMTVAFLLYFPWWDPNLAQKVSTADFWFAVWKRDWMQTLTHIALTTLWMLPCLRWNWLGRGLWLLGSVVLHVALSEVWYFHWVHASPSGIDGGPLGFLTWAIPAWSGLWAGGMWLQWRASTGTSEIPLWRQWLMIGIGLMSLGYLASCGTRHFDRSVGGESNPPKLAASPVLGRGLPVDQPRAEVGSSQLASWFAEPPFYPPPPPASRAWNYWMMSQRAGTMSYLVFTAGLSFVVYTMFAAMTTLWGLEVGLFRALGRNAIVAYAMHGFLIDAVGQILDRNAPLHWVAVGLTAVMAITWAITAFLDGRKLYIRL
jgi:predicted acyltransferase